MADRKTKFGLGSYNPASGFLVQPNQTSYDDPILSGGVSTMTGSSMSDALLNRIRDAAGLEAVNRKTAVPTQESGSGIVDAIRKASLGTLLQTDPALKAALDARSRVSPLQADDEAFDLAPTALDIFDPDSGGSSISGTKMPLASGDEKAGDATFGGKLPQEIAIDESITGESTSNVDATDAEAEAFRKAEETRGLSQGVQLDQTIGKSSDKKSSITEGQKTADAYQNLMQSALNSYNDAIGRAPSGAKSMAEYKKEFSEATGIDISGDPDNKAALTAFGLALMQNKAGKGFNVGNILSEVGAAGEKALPLMEAARKEARAGQLAAGQYALTTSATADATRQKFLIDQSNYLQQRQDSLLDKARARVEAIEDREDKQVAAQQLEYIKNNFDYQKAILQHDIDAAAGKFKADEKTTFKPIKGQNDLVVTMGIRESDGRSVFLFTDQAARNFGNALGNIQQGTDALDQMYEITDMVRRQGGGVNLQRAIEFGEGIAASFGFDLNSYVDADGKTKSYDQPLETVDAVRKRVISQFKRFLTQETGNGISNTDVKQIEQLLGGIDFFKNPQASLQRIQQARKIFEAPRAAIIAQLQDFDNPDKYLNQEDYELTMKMIEESALRSAGVAARGFEQTTDDAGNITYKLF